MKNLYLFFLVALFALPLSAQTVWDGPAVTFTKADNSDWTQEANQDRITEAIWLTRGSGGALFNIKTETEYDGNGGSPAGTEWAYGSTDDLASLTFDTWKNTQSSVGNSNSPDLNTPMVLRLVDADIYIDITFTSWTSGGGGSNGGGGGFSYSRSTENATNTLDLSDAGLAIVPNPAQTEIRIAGNKASLEYEIRSVAGALVREGRLEGNEGIRIADLSAGLYFFRTKEGHVGRFLKK